MSDLDNFKDAKLIVDSLKGNSTESDQKTVKEKCFWDTDIKNEYGLYETSCKHTFEFIDAGCKENGFKFCPFCGKSIEESI